VEDVLQGGHWDVHATTDLDTAYRLINGLPAQVGVARLEPGEAETIQPYVELVETTQKHMPWVALVASDALQHASVREAIANLFFDYHTLPIEPDHLRWSLGHALGMSRLVTRSRLETRKTASDDFVGASPAMREITRQIQKIAAIDAPVTITGESGTGKELAVRAIHRQSRRALKPLVAINCGAIPSSLIQAELFGYERGAFTGAQGRNIGRIESANGGTVFLDEIGELSTDQQVSLLRFLEQGAIQRLGNPREIPVDVRVFAATHTDLEAAVKAGRFREDLYYRLNVFRLHMPPLRERADDTQLLARYYFDQFVGDAQAPRGFTECALKAIKKYPWQGNVRELMNRVHRAVVMCERSVISPGDLGLPDPTANAIDASLTGVRRGADQEVLGKVLSETGHNLSEAARRIHISRPALYRLIKKYGLERQ
jgi:DNA-binding NtrC family response regulator